MLAVCSVCGQSAEAERLDFLLLEPEDGPTRADRRDFKMTPHLAKVGDLKLCEGSGHEPQAMLDVVSRGLVVTPAPLPDYISQANLMRVLEADLVLSRRGAEGFPDAVRWAGKSIACILLISHLRHSINPGGLLSAHEVGGFVEAELRRSGLPVELKPKAQQA